MNDNKAIFAVAGEEAFPKPHVQMVSPVSPSSARAAWVLAATVLVTLGVSLVWKPAPPPRYAGLAPVRARAPKEIAGFVSTGEVKFGKDVRDALAAADIMGRNYRDTQTGQDIDFLLIGGTDRSALHDPRSCMIGAGWRIENDHVETIPQTNTAIRACRIVGGGNTSEAAPGYEAMYLYVVSGKTINEVTQIRAQMAVSALIGRKNTPVCFVRFMRPLLPDAAADAKSHERLAQFASQMWRTLQIPQSQQTVQMAEAARALEQAKQTTLAAPDGKRAKG